MHSLKIRCVLLGVLALPTMALANELTAQPDNDATAGGLSLAGSSPGVYGQALQDLEGRVELGMRALNWAFDGGSFELVQSHFGMRILAADMIYGEYRAQTENMHRLHVGNESEALDSSRTMNEFGAGLAFQLPQAEVLRLGGGYSYRKDSADTAGMHNTKLFLEADSAGWFNQVELEFGRMKRGHEATTVSGKHVWFAPSMKGLGVGLGWSLGSLRLVEDGSMLDLDTRSIGLQMVVRN